MVAVHNDDADRGSENNGNRITNFQRRIKMTTGTQRAARAYKLALQVTADVDQMREDFPTASKKLEEVVRLLVSEGKKAEAKEEG
jgi:hypothetical protein